MGRDSDCGPVCRRELVDRRRAVLDDAAEELVHEMWVRAAVNAPLDERRMFVVLVVDAVLRELAYLLREPVGVVGNLHVGGVFPGVDKESTALSLLPLERLL